MLTYTTVTFRLHWEHADRSGYGLTGRGISGFADSSGCCVTGRGENGYTGSSGPGLADFEELRCAGDSGSLYACTKLIVVDFT